MLLLKYIQITGIICKCKELKNNEVGCTIHEFVRIEVYVLKIEDEVHHCEINRVS